VSKEGSVSPISEKDFALEKEVQTIVERNMQSIFNVEFVTSEFYLSNLRIDSIGFDKNSNSFVIIEYKKDRNLSVIDQGYAYLSLLLNNKAEFILVYNERNETIIKKDDVDWSQSKVIFVSPQFTTYQRKAIEFRDLPIELWEVKLFSNNTILFNQIQAPEKSESITKISQRSEIVNKVSKEIKTYDENYHFERSSNEIVPLFREVKEAILSIGSDITSKPTAKYIAFVRQSNFVALILYKSSLLIVLNLKKGNLNDPKKIARDVSNVGHWGNGDYEIKLENSNDLGYILTLIRQSYDKN
jgi:predicted transport protein